MAMEGFVADWYNRNTGRNLRRFEAVARAVAEAVFRHYRTAPSN
jgi:hypothetical protein